MIADSLMSGEQMRGASVPKIHEFPPGLGGYCYRLDKHKATMRSPHTHVELEFTLVLSGQARYILDDHIYVLSPYTLSWLFPAQRHILVDVSDDYTEWVYYIRREFIRKVVSDDSNMILLEDNPTGFYCRKLNPQKGLVLEDLMSDLDFKKDCSDLLNVELAYIFLKAWTFFLESSEKNKGMRIHRAVEKAATLMAHENYTDIDEVARQAGICHAHLCRLFRSEMGISMVRFRNMKRLERFFGLYHRADNTLMRAALDAGFGSYAQFYRVFKQHVGHAPNRLRIRETLKDK